jgi:hypothetical protein
MFGHQDDQDATAGQDDANRAALDALAGQDSTTPSSTPAAAPATVPAAETVEPQAVPPSTPQTSDEDLLQIKQAAIDQLSPLVNHLDQTPEEKFRTTMMMIQATDNQALIKVAYEAANAIPDEKVKAQALLDVVNEINYFTHKNSIEA